MTRTPLTIYPVELKKQRNRIRRLGRRIPIWKAFSFGIVLGTAVTFLIAAHVHTNFSLKGRGPNSPLPSWDKGTVKVIRPDIIYTAPIPEKTLEETVNQSHVFENCGINVSISTPIGYVFSNASVAFWANAYPAEWVPLEHTVVQSGVERISALWRNSTEREIMCDVTPCVEKLANSSGVGLIRRHQEELWLLASSLHLLCDLQQARKEAQYGRCLDRILHLLQIEMASYRRPMFVQTKEVCEYDRYRAMGVCDSTCRKMYSKYAQLSSDCSFNNYLHVLRFEPWSWFYEKSETIVSSCSIKADEIENATPTKPSLFSVAEIIVLTICVIIVGLAFVAVLLLCIIVNL